MEETDQEFEDLLHYLNLPGTLRVPVRIRALQCQDSGRVRRRYVAFAGPAREERCATGDPVCRLQPSSAVILSCMRTGSNTGPGARLSYARVVRRQP
jgi:hypothetical protein